MTQTGIKITDLRAEIQTLVNSAPNKYDPNSNGNIDDGAELSQLLSEYGCKTSDLTSQKGEEMFTKEEQKNIRDVARKNSRNDIDCLMFLSFLPTLGGIIASGVSYGNFQEAVRTQKGGFKALPKIVKTNHALALGISLGVAALGLFGIIKGPGLVQKSYEKDAKLDLKAKQTEQGAATMQERLKHEEEMRAREAALRKDELEYRQNMQSATAGVDANIKSAEKRAKSVNKELKEAQVKIQAKKDSI